MLTVQTTLAQPATSRGTEFWLTYLENLDLGFNGSPFLYLDISSTVTTQGELQVPSTGDAFPFTVNAGHSTIVFVPSLYLYPIGPETYYPDGLKVVSDDPVAVHAYHHRLYFSDATLVLPVEELDDDYFVIAQLDVSQTAPSEFGVLATVDGTEVEVTPSVQTASLRPAGVPFLISLDAGEVFQLQAYNDLTGSRVRSLDPAEPIAVFAGSKYGNENCLGATDHFFTEMMPVAAWGDQFALLPYLDRGGDDFKFLSIADGTTITLSTGASFVLDSGQYSTQHLSVPLIAEGDQPFAVAQLNESQACNTPGNGDGCMAFVPPLDHREQHTIFNSISGPGMPGGGWTPSHTLNIVTAGQTGAIAMDLDGAPIGALFQAIPSAPTWYYARLNVNEGEHVLQSATAFQAQASGFGDFNGYTFFTGYEQEDIGSGIVPGLSFPPQASCIVTTGPFLPDLTGLEARSIEVVDARGACVLSRTLVDRSVTLDLTGLAPGIHAVIVRGKDGVVIQRQRLVLVH